MTSIGHIDSLLDPGVEYHYVVRAYDSRSGEESNTVVKSAAAPVTPDIRPPIFAGLETAQPGAGCGEAALSWSAGLETCNAPISYEIYRSTDAGFAPSPATLVGSTLGTSFVDAAITPGETVTYLVRARDGAGNESTNDVRLTVDATNLDLVTSDTNGAGGAGCRHRR